MSFSSEIKTLLKLDSKNWEEGLESVKRAETSYFEEAKQNTATLIDSKDKLADVESKHAKELLALNTKIAKSEDAKTKAIESGNKKLTKQIQDKLKLLKQERTTLIANSKVSKDSIKSEIAETSKLISVQEKSRAFLLKAKANLISNKKAETDNTEAITAGTKAVDNKNKSMSNLANTTIRYLRWAGTIAGVVYAGQRAWNATIGTGIEVNKIIETNTNGIAALISANTQMTDSLGHTLSPLEKFRMGQEHAKDAIEEIRKESVKTAATFPQLLEIFQQGIGKALSLGDAFGVTTKDIEKNTIKLSSRMSNFANAIGMPMDRVKEEMRSMMSANASTDSLISTIIFGSPTEANKAVKDAQKRANGLTELFEKEFKPFDILADTKTFEKSILSVKDSWSRAMGDMVEKSGAFQDITDMFYDMSTDIKENTEGIVKGFDTLYNGIKDVTSALKYIAVPAAAVASVMALSKVTLALGGAVTALTIAVRANPILATLSAGLAGIYATSEAVGDLLDKVEKINAKAKAEQSTSGYIAKGLATDLKALDEQKKAIQASIDLWSKYNVPQEQIQKKQKELLAIEKQRAVINQKLSDIATADEAKANMKDKLALAKQVGTLVANEVRDEEILAEIKKEAINSEGKIAALEKEKAKRQELLVKVEEQLASRKKQYANADIKDQEALAVIIKQKEADKESYLQGISLKEKEIAEEQQSIEDKRSKDAEARYKKILAQNKAYAEQQGIELEIAMLESGNVDQTKLKLDLMEINIAKLGKEYDLTKDVAEQREIYRDILVKSLEYQKLYTAEVEKQATAEAKIQEQKTKIAVKSLTGDFKRSIDDDTIYAEAEDESFFAIEDMIDLGATEKQLAKFKELIENTLDDIKDDYLEEDYSIKIDMDTSNLDDGIKQLYEISDIFKETSEEQDEYNKRIKQYQGIIDSTTASDEDRAKAQDKYNKESTAHIENQISGYANLAGTTADMFDEKTAAYKALHALETGMHAAKMAMDLAEMFSMETKATTKVATDQVENASEATKTPILSLNAILAQGSIPIIGFALMAAMAALVLSYGGEASGGGGASPYSMAELATAETMKIEDQTTIDLLEQQVDLLEAIEKNGSAQKLSVDLAAAEFTQAKNEWVQDVFDQSRLGYVTAMFDENSAQWKAIQDYYEKNDLTNFFDMSGGKIKLDTMEARLNADEFIKVIADMTTFTRGEGYSYTGVINQKLAEEFGFSEEGIQATNAQIKASFSEIQGYLNEWAISVVDSVSELKDSAEDMKGYYDDITGTTKYATLALKEAFADFNSLLQNGESYSDFLVRNIDSIESSTKFIYELSGVLDENNKNLTNYELLLSKNGDLITQQMEKVAEFGAVTGQAFEGGVEEALNFADSIELVTEAMVTSRENIKSWQDSFKTDEELARDLAGTLGLSLATNLDDLNKIFIKLSNDAFGLTDAELEFLEVNKDYIESLDETTEALDEAAEAHEEYIQSLKDSLQSLRDGYSDMLNEMLADLANAFNEKITTMADAIDTLLGNKTDANTSDALIESFWGKKSQVETLLSKGGNLTSAEVTQLNSLTSELGSLSTSLQSSYTDNTFITDDLVNSLSDLDSRLDFTDQILQVKIVDGLGNLLDLNSSQLEQLQIASADGNITNEELANISGLTEVQKDGVVEFAANSNYLSTEATLANLEKWSKLQLDAYETEIAEASAGISKQTFTLGDNIGTQEQIDISEATGKEYEDIKSIITALQRINSSDNFEHDIPMLLGYNQGSSTYNKDTAEIIKSLAPYLDDSISSIISDIESEAVLNSTPNKIAGIYIKYDLDKYQTDSSGYDYWVSQVDSGRLSISEAEQAIKSEAQKLIPIQDTSMEVLGRYLTADGGLDYWVNELQNNPDVTQSNLGATMASGADSLDAQSALEWMANNNVIKGESLIDRLYNEGKFTNREALNLFDQFGMPNNNISSSLTGRNYFEIKDFYKENYPGYVKQFLNGGYTGDGSKYDIAGFVHKRERVITADDVTALGGASAVDRMIENEKASRTINSQLASSYRNKKEKNDIMETMKTNQQILVTGFNGIISILDEITDYNNEYRDKGYPSKVTGSVSIAG